MVVGQVLKIKIQIQDYWNSGCRAGRQDFHGSRAGMRPASNYQVVCRGAIRWNFCSRICLVAQIAQLPGQRVFANANRLKKQDAAFQRPLRPNPAQTWA
jgi:hypothetical protein